MIPVIWQSYANPAEVINRGYWDQQILEDLFEGVLWRPPGWPTFEHFDSFAAWDKDNRRPDGDAAVVVVPGRHNSDQVSTLNVDLKRFATVVVIITGDEEGVFPWWDIDHPHARMWVQTADPDGQRPDLWLINGYSPGARKWLPQRTAEIADKNQQGWFSGQITHERRKQMVRWAAKRRGAVHVNATAGFTQGIPEADYAREMARTQIAPAPSGPVHVDTFRAWEALEAGAVPLLDRQTPDRRMDHYWQQALSLSARDTVHDEIPLPVVDWSDSATWAMNDLLEDWPRSQLVAQSWWAQYKRALAYRARNDLCRPGGYHEIGDDLAEHLTVVIPTSPVEEHPSPRLIMETIDSVRRRLGWDVEILVMCDGVRDEQADYAARYHEYLGYLFRWANFTGENVLPIYWGEHLHQGQMMRRTLDLVNTPCVMFVEHDTPLVGEIPAGDICRVVEHGAIDMVRLHHEASILDVHQHLMLDDTRLVIDGVPLLRTVQWSQRPHIAATDWYRRLCDRYFGADSRTMIEDVMHGVVDGLWNSRRWAGWRDYKLAIYAPGGDMKRSTHLDGRGDDPKFEMVFDYDGQATPPWAPHPRRDEE